ncbi:hypothetical protein HAX54_004184 [Datura stramonium]|uniref:Uncharacterized protein n=1 Tax=Datura stramonium TaxID=4076 RepID=A0ABS8T7X3_DATST|nr:hypothetical protein [Datura stramonium]
MPSMGRRARVPIQKALESASMAGQLKKKDGGIKGVSLSLEKDVTGRKIEGSSSSQQLHPGKMGERRQATTVEGIHSSPRAYQSPDLQVSESDSARKVNIHTSPNRMQPSEAEVLDGKSSRKVMCDVVNVEIGTDELTNVYASDKLSWADEVERQQLNQRKSSVWDKFDITKMSNAGFKLEFVEPAKHGAKIITQTVQHTNNQIEEGTGSQQGIVSASDQKATQRRQIEELVLEEQNEKSKHRVTSMGVWVTPSSQNRQQGTNVIQDNSFQILEELEVESVVEMPRISPRKAGDKIPSGYG